MPPSIAPEVVIMLEAGGHPPSIGYADQTVIPNFDSEADCLKISNLEMNRRTAEELFVRIYVVIATVLLFLALIKYMAATLHWPLVFDTQEMLYINFLIRHGMVPYRDLTDINMPGVYLFHAVAAAIFGATDVGWRLCEFSLGFILIGSMTLIARPYGLFAGPLAGVLFLLLHGTHGPANAVQRDEITTVFTIAACAVLMESVRRRLPWLSAVFGVLIGLAITVKPSMLPLALLALAAAAYGARKQGLKVFPYVLYGSAGLVSGLSTSLLYLWYFHAFREFLFTSRTLLSAYLGSNAPTWTQMFVRLMQWPLKNFLLLALAADVTHHIADRKRGLQALEAERWEMLVLYSGIFVGLASYLLQHKGFSYHAYPFYAFLLLWAAVVTARAMRIPGFARWLALAALTYAVLRPMPMYLHQAEGFPSRDRFSSTLAADLRQLGTARLDRNVQCMDIVLGCMTALYHDQIVQYSGYTGDLLLFVPVRTPIVQYYRDLFFEKLQAGSPSVFVVTNERWGAPESFDKLDAWPEFKSYLEQNYVLTTQRKFIGDAEPLVSPLGSNTGNMAYRLYIRKGSPLLAYAPYTPAQ